MDKIIRKFTYTVAALLAVMVFIFSSYVGGGLGVAHAATSTTYSNVLEDLSKDETFNAADYPEVADDYSLNVIQIAESSDGELFIYVYQPSGQTVDLRASTINISTDKNNTLDLKFTSYSLEFINSYSTLYKYKVEDFSVLTASVRYYNLSQITRKWINGIDNTNEGENVGVYKAFSVVQLWTVVTVDGKISYLKEESEVVKIIKPYIGYIRYSNGWTLYNQSCDRHYIVFSTDKQIDQLMEADVSYSYRIKTVINGFEAFGDEVNENLTLYDTDEASNSAHGWFAEKYTWNRIQSVDTFISENEAVLSSERYEIISQGEWVFSFCDTDYNEDAGGMGVGITIETSTVVTGVAVLRLRFKTKGVPYNLGVVSDIVSEGDNQTPDGEYDDLNFGFQTNWQKIFKIILGFLLLILFLVVFIPIIISLIISIIKKIFKKE